MSSIRPKNIIAPLQFDAPPILVMKRTAAIGINLITHAHCGSDVAPLTTAIKRTTPSVIIPI